MTGSEDIDHLIELPGVYDGWSIAVHKDGTMHNRWTNDEGTGPREGYAWRWQKTQDAIDTALRMRAQEADYQQHWTKKEE